MRFDRVENYRMTCPAIALSPDAGKGSGAFNIPYRKNNKTIYFTVIAESESSGWDHVSVSSKKRIPTWDEMCFIKDLFFDDEDVVIQIHPKKSQYVNFHAHCLHLWRAINPELWKEIEGAK